MGSGVGMGCGDGNGGLRYGRRGLLVCLSCCLAVLMECFTRGLTKSTNSCS